MYVETKIQFWCTSFWYFYSQGQHATHTHRYWLKEMQGDLINNKDGNIVLFLPENSPWLVFPSNNNKMIGTIEAFDFLIFHFSCKNFMKKYMVVTNDLSSKYEVISLKNVL